MYVLLTKIGEKNLIYETDFAQIKYLCHPILSYAHRHYQVCFCKYNHGSLWNILTCDVYMRELFTKTNVFDVFIVVLLSHAGNHTKKIFDNRCVTIIIHMLLVSVAMKTATFINTFVNVCHETGENKFENK